jgi:hypothetical protein
MKGKEGKTEEDEEEDGGGRGNEGAGISKKNDKGK